MTAVEVSDLVKNYGSFAALRGISFNVNEGEIFGLIGPNGAGKTTTFRILATLLAPTSGSVKTYNYDIVKDSHRVRKLISYLPEDAGVYKNITAYEYLKLIAKIYFGSTPDFTKSLELGEKLSGLGDKIHDKMKTYSKGMKRRVQIARTLMVKPKIAILDEPTAGLDVVYSHMIRELIKDFVRTYKTTVLISSHNMLEVEGLCDRVALISEGRILAEGPVNNLINNFGVRNLEELFIKLVGA
ncbi:MAG: ABC transporter ATP-binding protein [Sulfolobales archaeon]